MKVSDLIPGDRLVMIAKGDPGVGKTVFEGSFPGVFFIDLDQRMMPLNTYPLFKNKEIEFETCTRFKEVENLIDRLINHNPYGTVVLASLTRLARLLMKQALTMKGEGKGMRKSGIAINTVEDYSVESAGITQIVDAMLNDLKCHIILEAHVIEVSSYGKSDSTNLPRRLFTGAKPIAAEIPAYFDEVYHFDVDQSIVEGTEPKRVFYTRHMGNEWAKTALPLPAKIEFTNGSGYDIIKRILKNKEIELKDIIIRANNTIKLGDKPKKEEV